MPECHKCPHDGKGSDACITCGGAAETNHKGRSHVSIDAGDGQTLGEVEASIAAVWRGWEGERFPEVSPDAVKVAAAFLSMDDAEFALVRSLMSGKSMSDVAREEGVTRASVSWRVKRLAGRHPVFAFLRRR